MSAGPEHHLLRRERTRFLTQTRKLQHCDGSLPLLASMDSDVIEPMRDICAQAGCKSRVEAVALSGEGDEPGGRPNLIKGLLPLPFVNTFADVTLVAGCRSNGVVSCFGRQENTRRTSIMCSGQPALLDLLIAIN